MQEKHLFEYAVIRIVPRVEREEFLNAGVILYCQAQGFLQSRVMLNVERMSVFCPQSDADEIKHNLQAIERICLGAVDTGPIGTLDRASRFRWLTATRSTVIQTSRVHPGFCADASETLEKLFLSLVAQ